MKEEGSPDLSFYQKFAWSHHRADYIEFEKGLLRAARVGESPNRGTSIDGAEEHSTGTG